MRTKEFPEIVGCEMARQYIGVDIGGTKCALTLGRECDGAIEILYKKQFPTVGTPNEVLDRFCGEIQAALLNIGTEASDFSAIGISCGGPLDSLRGVIQSPPNLPGWDDIFVTDFFTKRIGLPAYLENDANACAIAEWRWGAGKGMGNMIFLTFGTGLGAGLILDGKLYSGTNGNAGEIGHVRLRADGPVGYGKSGSAEGFCSGGGLSQQGRVAAEHDPMGAAPLLAACGGLDEINAKEIAILADAGDAFCQAIYTACGERLGETLALLVDLFNPEAIVLGGVYMRSSNLLAAGMQKTLAREALPQSVAVCRILPAGLGEHIGDYAALAIAACAQK